MHRKYNIYIGCSFARNILVVILQPMTHLPMFMNAIHFLISFIPSLDILFLFFLLLHLLLFPSRFLLFLLLLSLIVNSCCPVACCRFYSFIVSFLKRLRWLSFSGLTFSGLTFSGLTFSGSIIHLNEIILNCLNRWKKLICLWNRQLNI